MVAGAFAGRRTCRTPFEGCSMDPQDVRLSEVLFEFIPNGRFVKVVAIDPVSRIEIAMVGDRMAGNATLKRLAINKLKYVIAKKRGAPESPRRDENTY